MAGIGGRIDEISGVAAAIAAAVEEQGAATREIVRNVSQAAVGTGEVTGTIAGVAGAAGDRRRREPGAQFGFRAVASVGAAVGRGDALPRHRAGGLKRVRVV